MLFFYINKKYERRLLQVIMRLKQNSIIKTIAVLLLLLLLNSANISAAGNIFYVTPSDPENDVEGDGSYENPWRNLQDVISKKVETRCSKNSPYDGELIIKNEGAPIKTGDTIILKDGFYSILSISHAFNEDYITLKAENKHQAVFSHINISSASHWILEGLAVNREIEKIEPEQQHDPKANQLMRLVSGWHGPVQYITIEECDFFTISDTSTWSKEDWDDGTVNGIWSSGEFITINNNHIMNINYGIVIQGGSNTIVSNNLIEEITADGLQGIGDDLLFENNIIKNFYQVDGNHLDGFQSWIVPPNDPNGDSCDRITLRGNIIIEHEDRTHPYKASLQGIGCFDGPYYDWVIENNVIIVGHYHGITMSGAQNCKVINNTVVSPVDSDISNPHIKIGNTKGGLPSQNVIVRNNIARRFDIFDKDDESIIMDHNLEVSNSDYDLLFINHANNDLHLRPGSLAINTGSSELAPDIDIEGNPRPHGSEYDIGAYEYLGEFALPPAAPENLEVE